MAVCSSPCDAGQSCGICLNKLPRSNCPNVTVAEGLQPCSNAPAGSLCLADQVARCGADTYLNNCVGQRDVYKHELCVLSPPLPSSPTHDPLTTMPSTPPPLVPPSPSALFAAPAPTAATPPPMPSPPPVPSPASQPLTLALMSPELPPIDQTAPPANYTPLQGVIAATSGLGGREGLPLTSGGGSGGSGGGGALPSIALAALLVPLSIVLFVVGRRHWRARTFALVPPPSSPFGGRFGRMVYGSVPSPLYGELTSGMGPTTPPLVMGLGGRCAEDQVGARWGGVGKG